MAEFTEENIAEAVEEYASEARVSILDIDFWLILSFALLMDSLDFIFFIVKTLPLGVPGSALHLIELVDTPFDIFAFMVITAWMYWRLKRIAQRKKIAIAVLRKQLIQLAAKFQKFLVNLEKRLTSLATRLRSPFLKALIRAGITFIAESLNFIIPLIGALIELIPFWTITVILTLREK